MREPLTITLTRGATFVRVVAVGALDRDDASRLARYLKAVAFTFDGRIDLDLRELDAIDAHGIRLLIGLRRQLGRRLRFIPSEELARAVHLVARSEGHRRDGAEDAQLLAPPAK